jgi:hypothetical protein
MKQYITKHNPVLSVWFMKQTDKSFVSYFEKNSEEDFRNLIKLNAIMTNN